MSTDSDWPDVDQIIRTLPRATRQTIKKNTHRAPVSLLISSEKAAELLGVCTRTFHNLRKEEGFPKARKMGKKFVRWIPAEIEAWANSLEKLNPDEVQQPQQLVAGKAKNTMWKD